MAWTTVKPDFKEECICLTASEFYYGWEYHVWVIEYVNNGDGTYLAWLDGEGEEYGDLCDMKADMYNVLPILKSEIP